VASLLTADWILILIALVLPIPVALVAAWLFWRRNQADVGNVVGSGIIFFIAICCFGDELVRILRVTTACEAAGTPCVMSPSPLVRFTIFGVIAFLQVAVLYTVSVVHQERAQRRAYWQ
jgi:hypothetical protein